MPGDPGPMVRRRQLSALLHQYRIRSGKSAKEVAEAMFEAPSKITRIEKGQRLASARDIVDLCRIYDLPDDVRDQLMELARGSRERQWWQRPGISPSAQVWIGMEGAAESISAYETIAVPGLLQTPEYTDAILRNGWVSDSGKRSEMVAVRMRRQQILQLEQPPRYRVVLDEAAVRRVVGSPEIMRRQREHLLQMTSSGRCELRIIPFGAGVHRGMENSFMVLEFGNLTALDEEAPIPGIVFLEMSGGDRYLEDGEDVAYHSALFNQLLTHALPTEESIDLIRS